MVLIFLKNIAAKELKFELIGVPLKVIVLS